jgi:hypothetical protein
VIGVKCGTVVELSEAEAINDVFVLTSEIKV